MKFQIKFTNTKVDSVHFFFNFSNKYCDFSSTIIAFELHQTNIHFDFPLGIGVSSHEILYATELFTYVLSEHKPEPLTKYDIL